MSISAKINEAVINWVLPKIDKILVRLYKIE